MPAVASIAKPPCRSNARREIRCRSLRDQLLQRLRDIPQNDVVMRVGHARVAGILVDADMFDRTSGRWETGKGLLRVEILQRDLARRPATARPILRYSMA